jgi:hypothetical protein
MVTRLQQGSTKHTILLPEPPQKPNPKKILEKSKTKIQGFSQFQTHPETKGNKTKQNEKLEMFVTSKSTSKPSRNQETETEQP